MKNIQNLIINNLVIGTFSGVIYTSIELLFRGRTYWSMFFLAFIVGLLLSIINDEILEYDDYYEYQVLLGTAICILFEGLFGILFNQNYTIWDYRGKVGTFFYGQLNLIFCGAWLVITAFGIPLLDWLQYKLQITPKPYYRSWIVEKFFRRKGD